MRNDYQNSKTSILSGVMLRLISLVFVIPCLSISPVKAQKFFNLTAQEVKIDTLLPVFNYTHELGHRYADSTYSVTIDYPEFITMNPTDVERYMQLSGRPLGELPEIHQQISVSRKQGSLHIAFVPLVFRDGKYQKLVSFQLKVKGEEKKAEYKRAAPQRSAADRYASNSVLASGRWVKIGVPSTGIWQLTDELIRQAGFSDMSRVKIYGYGGAMQPEKLTADYIAATDDLRELPTCYVGGKRLFYGVGPVSWDDKHQRIRNPYSTYGSYFLTENGETATTLSWEEFLAEYYPLKDHYCSLYEKEEYAWFHGGRNLYESRVLTNGTPNNYTVDATGNSNTGTVTISISAATNTSGSVVVSVNGASVGTISIPSMGSYDHMRTAVETFNVDNLSASNQITLTPNGNCGTVRLDYISTYATAPRNAADPNQNFGVPSIIGVITNQNHHADAFADMVIIIPTTQKLLAQAERLKALHSQQDGLRVNIVPADELYNEFSSGTPDANAYRRYMKMLYDRATTEEDMPRYLLLLGDCAWDNRMLCPEWKGYSPDDFLLCYESENSYSATKCYVSDDYFGLLDDDEGGAILTADKIDIGVGRISARTVSEATIAVNKIESYITNREAGAWQNQLCFMGDDGNSNAHMNDADAVARLVEENYPNLVVKRVMWDAYNRVSSSTGNRYPDATRVIKQQMQQGALMMNYSGHGGAASFSHEYVVQLPDFQASTSLRLPLWVTASCDIMPFDGQEANIGEAALFNPNGGAIAFYGTTRTVYQAQNRLMNHSFTRYVLSKDDAGRPLPIGEAVRLTKNELITTGVFTGYDSKGNETRSTDRSENRMQYSLLGDPAVRLAMPTRDLEVTAINDTPISNETRLVLKAGSTAKVSGRILNTSAATDETFNGVLTALVRDVEEKVTCRLNDPGEASTPFVYTDRPNTIFNGSNYVKDGLFTFSFAVPKDIKYSDLTALINIYAINNEKTVEANGICNSLVLNGTESTTGGAAGPDIYCYLNSESFSNGGTVNSTPYFVANIHDEDGINASGSGIGHSLQLIIDGNASTTYTLNDYFQFDFGSYTSGTVGFSIPQLSAGEHKLLFRAWDVLNNSSTAELTFNVVKGLEPNFADVECSPNPAREYTNFRLIHDRMGSEMDVKLDIFDSSGRLLWTHSENGVPSDQTYTLHWDLTTDGGKRLNTGLYLYRVSISSDGSSYVSKAKKLIILTNK